jgi:hypothetical protein
MLRTLSRLRRGCSSKILLLPSSSSCRRNFKFGVDQWTDTTLREIEDSWRGKVKAEMDR